jgi:lactobin A/cerein 7B family class IIb bacteriocin
METLKPLHKEELVEASGGFLPIVILGTTYSAKAVAGYFLGVASATSAITTAVMTSD